MSAPTSTCAFVQVAQKTRSHVLRLVTIITAGSLHDGMHGRYVGSLHSWWVALAFGRARVRDAQLVDELEFIFFFFFFVELICMQIPFLTYV